MHPVTLRRENANWQLIKMVHCPRCGCTVICWRNIKSEKRPIKANVIAKLSSSYETFRVISLNGT